MITIRRASLQACVYVCLGLMCLSSGSHASERQNLLVITVDDLKRVIGVLADRPGNLLNQLYPDPQVRASIKAVLSPNIDQLAANGVLFTNAYAVAPVCNPSRISLATGTRPDLSGFTTNKDLFREDPLGASLVTMQQNLRNHGYFATGVGKIFHKSKITLSAEDQSITQDWPDTKYSWDVWINRNAGSEGDITYSPYSTSNGAIRFGSVSTALNIQNDYRNAGYIADLLDDGAAVFYDSVYKQNVSVTLPTDAPFYLGLGIYLPHQPFVAPKDIIALFDPDLMQVDADSLQAIQDDLLDLSAGGQYVTGADGRITTEFQKLLQKGLEQDGMGGDLTAWKAVIQHYLAAVAVADRSVGVALDALANSAYSDNTIVILHSDHGFNLGEKNRLGKNDVWDESTGSVLIVSKPGVSPAVIENSVSLQDIYPTVTAFAQAELPANVLGNDLSAYFSDPSLHWSKPSFSTQGALANRHSVRTNQYRYVRFYDDPANAELYDLNSDPDELTNLIDNAAYQNERQALDVLLDNIRASAVSSPVVVALDDVFSKVGSGVGTPANVDAWHASGEMVSFIANGLPEGVVLDSQSGEFSGIPIVAGVFYPSVEAVSASGSVSTNFTWTVLGDTNAMAPIWISGATQLINITSSTVELSWSGATGAENIAGYQIYVYSGGGISDTRLVSDTTAIIDNLLPETTYGITIQAIAENGLMSSDGPSVSVTTTALADSQKPIWNNGILSYTELDSTSISVSWAGAADDVSVTGYVLTVSGASSPVVVNTTSSPTIIEQLLPGASYTITVQASDAAGNVSVDGPSVVVEKQVVDNNPPYWLAGSIQVTNVIGSSATVSWTSAADDTGTVTYSVVMNGQPLGETANAYFELNDLLPGATNLLEVYAIDAAGNTSLEPLSVDVIADQISQSVIYFSTFGSVLLPGLAPPYDDANIYAWDEGMATNNLSASELGLPLSADIDAFEFVSDDHFYFSFISSTVVPDIGLVLDRDIVEYRNGVWTLFATGRSMGLVSAAHDIDGLSFYDNTLYLSITAATSLQGIGAVDDADILKWNGTGVEMVWDASEHGLPANADVDGLDVLSDNKYLMSFNASNTSVPDIGNVQDEDIVEFDTGVWSVYFDGTANALTRSGQDIDGLSMGSLSVPVPVIDTISPVWNNPQVSLLAATSSSIELQWSEAEDDVGVVDYQIAYQNDMSSTVVTSATNSVSLQGLSPATFYSIAIQAVDEAGNVSTGGPEILVLTEDQEVSAPPASFYFSTLGSSKLGGIAGTADDADIYSHNSDTFNRVWDASSGGLPSAADIDAMSIVSEQHFYVSFIASNTTIPGLGAVQDEDVVEYNNGSWSVYFDGTSAGLKAGGHDIDALSIVGGTVYFSTVGASAPPGMKTPDDADIYTWDGAVFSRWFDATENGLASSADIDALTVLGEDRFMVSFNASSTSVPGVGVVQDEDIVLFQDGIWSLYFDGTANGLTSGGHDIDALSIPASD